MCNISKGSGMGRVLQKCKLIVWDECTMAQKKSLDALHRSLQDFRGNIRPFGSALILLAGDLRQTLPVIPRSTPADEINVCLKYSTLWRQVKTLKLTTNMRVQLQDDRSADIFSHKLLEIGNGKEPVDLTLGQISLPHNFCNLVTSKEELVEKVFPHIQTNYKNRDWLSERAILAAKNKDVFELNNIIQSTFTVIQGSNKGLNTGGTVYSVEPSNNARSCVYIRNHVNALPLLELCSRDTAAVRITYPYREGSRELIVASVYLPYDSDGPPPNKEMKDITDYRFSRKKQLIIVCDANAHHILWGSTGTNPRGENLMELLVSSNLNILNHGNEPTFVVCNRKEVIDLTLGTNKIENLVSNWHVSDEPYLSDHRYICFKIRNITVDQITFRNPKRTN
ncbi:hypothetical protein B7P43_G17795 [Cryptotermes secundus]|uniref:ATP-dependent DNA helicase n=1 Tax=Cryptotermes secundus TaxID=105785 RepID=A0A2J7PF99_9NEOP|nr:hypothetical protein B7P43_G17795 [Cryptotermes secundus]